MTDLQQRIAARADVIGVPVDVAFAVAQTESAFSQSARSPVGAIGVFQLMPTTAAGLGVDPFDTDQNITGGLTYLKQLYDKYGNWSDAAAAYNAGPGRVDKYYAGKATLPAETTDYVGKVLSRIEQWAGKLGLAAPATENQNENSTSTPSTTYPPRQIYTADTTDGLSYPTFDDSSSPSSLSSNPKLIAGVAVAGVLLYLALAD